LLTVVGVVKLVMAGAIATPLAFRFLRENYKNISKLNDTKWFEYPYCKCSTIVKY